MTTRRRFLQSALGAGVFAAPLAALTDDALRVVDRARARLRHDDPEKIARDERYWRDIQSAFTIDRNWMTLNNGGVCPSPRAGSEAMRRYLAEKPKGTHGAHKYGFEHTGLDMNVERRRFADYLEKYDVPAEG